MPPRAAGDRAHGRARRKRERERERERADRWPLSLRAFPTPSPFPPLSTPPHATMQTCLTKCVCRRREPVQSLPHPARAGAPARGARAGSGARVTIAHPHQQQTLAWRSPAPLADPSLNPLSQPGPPPSSRPARPVRFSCLPPLVLLARPSSVLDRSSVGMSRPEAAARGGRRESKTVRRRRTLTLSLLSSHHRPPLRRRPRVRQRVPPRGECIAGLGRVSQRVGRAAAPLGGRICRATPDLLAASRSHSPSPPQALGSLLAGTAALVAGSANAIDLFDDRKAREVRERERERE